MAGALQGIRIVEVANYVTGPYASMLLADLGAEVVKVEAPPHGDPFRSWGTGGYASNFCALNRNKRSLRLDLSSESGREVFGKLLAGSDVFIENLRPGAMDRLGFSYEAVQAINPRLIYCSITGFGEDGPYAHRPGYDTVGQALSGLLAVLTNLEAPQPMGISLSDHLTGVFACYGVLAAVCARFQTGVGQKVETSLLQATLSFMAENAARYLVGGEVPTRESRTRTAGVYAFVAGDGLPFIVHLSSPAKFWEGLTEAAGQPDLQTDPRFAERSGREKNYHELHAILAEIFGRQPRQHWLEILEAHDVPCAPLNTMAEALADPQVQHLGMVKTLHHPEKGEVKSIGSAVNLSATPPQTRSAPPTLGEHSAEVLAELGYGDGEIEAMAEAGTI